MKKIWEFLYSLENSKKLGGLLLLLCVPATLIVSLLDQSYYYYVLSVVLVIIVIYIFFILAEISTMLLRNRLGFVGVYLVTMLNYIGRFSKLIIRYLYVYPLAVLLKPVVIHIISERQYNNSDYFIFENQKTGQEDDDHYFPKLLSSHKLRVRIKPLGDSRRWRFGLQFTPNQAPYSGRLGDQYVLFHLTKDQDKNSLRYHIYQGVNLTQQGVVTEQYQEEQCEIEVKSEKDKLKIKFKLVNITRTSSVTIPNLQYVRLVAWADGQMPFKLQTSIDES